MNDLAVRIIPLQDQAEAQRSYCCMTEVPTPWPQALCLCRDWVTENLGKHVEGFHLQLESGQIAGHLYFAPSDVALIPYQVEPGAVVLYCEWVHTRYQDQGLGRRLFDSFLGRVRQEGFKGILVEATDIQSQMHFSHYQKRGFNTVYTAGHRQLMYLPLAQETIQAEPLSSRLQPHKAHPVEILVFHGYMCPYEAATLMDLRLVAQEFGAQVHLREVWLTPESLREYGVARGIFINGVQALFGAEPEGAIRAAIRAAIQDAASSPGKGSP